MEVFLDGFDQDVGKLAIDEVHHIDQHKDHDHQGCTPAEVGEDRPSADCRNTVFAQSDGLTVGHVVSSSAATFSTETTGATALCHDRRLTRADTEPG